MVTYTCKNRVITSTLQGAADDLIEHGRIELDKDNASQAYDIGDLTPLGKGCVTFARNLDDTRVLTWTPRSE